MAIDVDSRERRRTRRIGTTSRTIAGNDGRAVADGLRTGTARHGRHGSSGDGDRADERDQLLHGQVQLMASAAVTKVGHASKQTRLLVDLLYISRLCRCTLNRWACPWRNALLIRQQKLHCTERKRTTVHTVRCSTSRRIQ